MKMLLANATAGSIWRDIIYTNAVIQAEYQTKDKANNKYPIPRLHGRAMKCV